MEESLRERELTPEDPNAAYAVLKDGPPAYEADVEAYREDPADDPYRKLAESVDAGATIQLSLACKDGRRELVELDRQASAAWIRDPFPDRLAYANARIREKRATLAARAARRLLTEGGAVVADRARLRPDEEAALREFELLEEALVPREEGGYDKRLRLREDRGRAAASRLREDGFVDGSDGFWDGTFDDPTAVGYDAPSEREYLPRGGPQGQQQQISDVFDAQAKCYYAWAHDPVIHAAVELVTDFVLGRSISIIAKSDKVQAVIDEFMNRELLPQSLRSPTSAGNAGRITTRLHDMITSIWRDGELLLRKFPLGDGRLKTRVLPPETIWEIVTDVEDPLDVFWYVQRYQSRVELFAPSDLPQAKTRWIERTIPAVEMLHVLINAKESDVRGRSDIYPALGWAKRLRDYFDARIQKEYAGAAFQWWYQVAGGAGDLANLAASVLPSSRPQPGSFIMTNDAIKVQSLPSQVRTVSGEGSAYDALLNHIALAFMLNKSYFGADAHTNRATALVATEPTAKHLEARQDLVIAFLNRLISDVLVEAIKYGKLGEKEDLSFRCELPSIIKADATTRAQLLRQGEGMGYFSKQRCAEAYAGEAEIDDYDFDEEMDAIEKEIGQDPRKLIMRDVEMIKKGGPEPTDVAFDPSEVPNPAYAGNATNGKGAGGNGKSTGLRQPDPHDASPTSGTGAAAIRKDLGTGSSGDRRTMASEAAIADDAAFREYAAKRGAVVIFPD